MWASYKNHRDGDREGRSSELVLCFVHGLWRCRYSSKTGAGMPTSQPNSTAGFTAGGGCHRGSSRQGTRVGSS